MLQPEPERPSSPLFRSEALAAQADRLPGMPVAILPPSWKMLTLLLSALVCIAIVFLATASYSRKERVRGVLQTVGGDIRVSARVGTVQELFVEDDTVVVRGTPLALISTGRRLESGVLEDEQMLAALAREEEALRARLASFDEAARHEESAIAAEITALIAEHEATRATVVSSAERLRVAEQGFALAQRFGSEGFIAGDEMRRREDAVIVMRQAQVDARAQERVLMARIAEREAQRAQRPHAAMGQRHEMEAQLAALAQRSARLEGERSYVLSAQIAGRVTAVQARVGQPVDAQRPLMTLIPADRQLCAELYVPSRAIGFVRRGQRVRLLYDAFPHERFGPAFGVIEAVADTVLMPYEVQAAVKIEEPAYRVLVRLDRDTVDAFGTALPLRAGIALSADIVLEARTFAEWLFEPMLAMRARA